MTSCPNGQHTKDFRQCGYAGCIDLHPWAVLHRYKWRYEESYKAERQSRMRNPPNILKIFLGTVLKISI